MFYQFIVTSITILFYLVFLEAKLKEGCADVLCYKCKEGFYKHIDEYYINQCLKKCPDGYSVVNNRCRGKILYDLF